MSAETRHLGVLDGWRGISILLVLAAHLAPLSPKSWDFNEMAARMGMALFFALSGFLITRLLLTNESVTVFLTRRLFRIVPLAWLAIAVAFPLAGAPASTYLPNLFFYANLPPYHLADAAAHFWSLGVEMQFYALVAVIVAVFGSRGLFALPVLCLVVTLHRAATGAYMEIVTWHRVDEILSGATLALIYFAKPGGALKAVVGKASVTRVAVLAVLFAIASHPESGFMNYFRPYFAALLVGSTLVLPPARVAIVLNSRFLRYIAAISFALYVVHGLLMTSWLGVGDRTVKYLKRPLLIAATFALAHVSTFHYERHWIDLGRRLSSRGKATSA